MHQNLWVYSLSTVSLLGTEIWYGTEIFVRTYPRARSSATVTSKSVADALIIVLSIVWCIYTRITAFGKEASDNLLTKIDSLPKRVLV